MNVTHDGKLLIAVGRSRKSTQWQNKEFNWSELLDKLAQTTRTRETAAEYAALPKGERDNIKDVGGFVGGYLKNGKRNNASVVNRCLVCLDADYADEGMLDDLDLTFINAYALYSTHSHTPEKMRLRLIIPLSRTVTPDEYAAVSRRIADELTLTRFDPTTFEPARLMYWPSTPEDGEFVFRYNDAPFLDPDAVLATYPDWTDASLWPTTRPLEERTRAKIDKQENPLEKKGIIGAFCRAHSITDVLEHVLSDRYTPTEQDDRYTFIGGSTTGGLVIYDDKYAYSHHATDPAGGKLCNAFDLVRLHLFTPGQPAFDGTFIEDDHASMKAMQEYASRDETTKRQLAEERLQQAEEEFAPSAASPSPETTVGDRFDDPDWQKGLELDKTGKVKDNLQNLIRIMRYDKRLRGIAYNLLSSAIDVRCGGYGDEENEEHRLPWLQTKRGWTEYDASSLRSYIDLVYGLWSPTKLKDAVAAVAAERAYHPIREYLNALPAWDGVPRVDTLLINYLGAADTIYTRAVTRKTLTAAVARIYRPGLKFDYVLVLNGRQGIGKSTFFARLAGKWFSDSLSIADMKDKTAPEKMQNAWILELGELAGLKKMDVETLKAFLSRQDDKYRPSYGISVEDHPRQCVIVGSTNNNDGFLRDITGNRRFWPVTCEGSDRHPWEIEAVEQIWAECIVHFRSGERLFLTAEEESMAKLEQNAALESDEREGLIAEYLEKLLPEDWDKMDLAERRGFLRGDHFTGGDRVGTVRRRTVCALEVWCECLGKEPATLRRTDAFEIFGMLQRIGGWERSTINKIGSRRFALYGMQRAYDRVKP